MTDNEIIIKALMTKAENMISAVVDENKKTHFITNEDVANLINRLQAENKQNENIIRLADKTIETANAEIERLKAKCENTQVGYNSLKADFEETEKRNRDLVRAFQSHKAEAYKEFAERLKSEIDIRPTYSREQNKYVFFLIDNLLKEMVGEDNGNRAT